LDLGQAADYTAFAAVEQSRTTGAGGRFVNAYAVRDLRRWPLGTSYPAVIADVAVLADTPPLRGCPAAVDTTVVGRSVIELLRQARVRCWLRPVTITGGHAVGDDPATGEVTVPKKELVSALQVPLQARRLAVPTSGDGPTLARELAAFRVRAAGNETAANWRDGAHDDLVFAVAMAIWLAERVFPAVGPWLPSPARSDRPTFRRAPPWTGPRPPTFG
jgi:hypothetical protein